MRRSHDLRVGSKQDLLVLCNACEGQSRAVVEGQQVIVDGGRRDINRACNSVRTAAYHSRGGWRPTEDPSTDTSWLTVERSFLHSYSEKITIFLFFFSATRVMFKYRI